MAEDIKSDKIWFYAKSSREKYGPYTDDEMIKLIRNGLVTGKDYIWMVDLDDWILVENSVYNYYLPAE